MGLWLDRHFYTTATTFRESRPRRLLHDSLKAGPQRSRRWDGARALKGSLCFQAAGGIMISECLDGHGKDEKLHLGLLLFVIISPPSLKAIPEILETS